MMCQPVALGDINPSNAFGCSPNSAEARENSQRFQWMSISPLLSFYQSIFSAVSIIFCLKILQLRNFQQQFFFCFLKLHFFSLLTLLGFYIFVVQYISLQPRLFLHSEFKAMNFSCQGDTAVGISRNRDATLDVQGAIQLYIIFSSQMLPLTKQCCLSQHEAYRLAEYNMGLC